MSYRWGVLATLALCGAAFAGVAGGVAWDKPESAQARSAVTGTPICYYFLQDAALKEGGT